MQPVGRISIKLLVLMVFEVFNLIRFLLVIYNNDVNNINFNSNSNNNSNINERINNIDDFDKENELNVINKSEINKNNNSIKINSNNTDSNGNNLGHQKIKVEYL